MDGSSSPERKAAKLAIAAAAGGYLLTRVSESDIWYSANSISGFAFKCLYLFVIYMCMPCAFSHMLLSCVAYALDVKNSVTALNAVSLALLLIALVSAAGVTIWLQAGTVIIITGVILVLRIAWRLR